MVRLMRREPVVEYELRDSAGRTIGRVIEPVAAPRTGPGAETVLLVRPAHPVARVSTAA